MLRLAPIVRRYSTPQPVLRQFNVLDGVEPNARLITRVTDFGFSVGKLNYKGAILVINNTVHLWDVPQYGVGLQIHNKRGPDDDVEPLATGALDDPASVFHGWTADMMDILAVMKEKPGIIYLTQVFSK